MKRMTVAAALILVGATLLAGCFGKKETVENAAADGVLTVGIINGDDRYARADAQAGGWTGMEPEILELLGVTLNYQMVSDVETLMQQLDAGAIDVAAGHLTRVDSYVSSHAASRSYTKSGVYLITEKERYVDTLAGFEEGTAIGVSWQIPVTNALALPHIDVLQQTAVSDIMTIPEDIASGVFGAALCTEREARALLESGADVQIAELTGSEKLENVFYLASDQTELCSQLNDAINQYLDLQAKGPVEDEEE